MKDLNVDSILMNGARVVARFESVKGGIVLATRQGAYQPWVTWFYNLGNDESTTAGHYFETYSEAWEDFMERVSKDK